MKSCATNGNSLSSVEGLGVEDGVLLGVLCRTGDFVLLVFFPSVFWKAI